jgi:hypothetical protein
VTSKKTSAETPDELMAVLNCNFEVQTSDAKSPAEAHFALARARSRKATEKKASAREKDPVVSMRKRLISAIPRDRVSSDEGGLDLANLGMVEITSEDEAYPIECALLQLGERRGWRAAKPGPQIIRLLFDQPQRLKRIWLVFEEAENQRTQEFILRWSPDHGRSFREIVRQQWNFSPPGTVLETEDYDVDLSDVSVLELRILPDQSGGTARASLASLRLA